ncbi:RES family NAD+ phosphorylase [Roseateles sp. GG27B]
MTAVWRISYCQLPTPDLASVLAGLGFGSTIANGRWHAKGAHQVVYAGASRALCQLEKRVHCNGFTPKNQALMRLELPPTSTTVSATDLGLPLGWRNRQGSTQSIGMAWLASMASLGLWVPSFVEPSEMNLLLNPAHPQYSSIELSIERNPFEFDPRL